MRLSPRQVLYEDNHLLVLDKPSNLATMGVREGEPSLLSAAREYIKRKHNKPGNVYLGVVSRLDAMASGVVVFARTSKAAARLSAQFLERSVEKQYLAIVEGRVAPQQGAFEDYLIKDETAGRMKSVRPPHPSQTPRDGQGDDDGGARFARLEYRVVAYLPEGTGRAVSPPVATLLEVALETGRKHQIRVQCASRGHPILGDRKYGSRRAFTHGAAAAGIALHSRRLSFDHPVRGKRMSFESPLPASFRGVGVVDLPE